jgi:8-oxo-dGTP pyrophosphatase MutT (NUDIX family)
MKNYKVLHDNDDFSVIELDGIVGTKMKYTSVAIMPYTVDEHGMVDKIGLLKEFNPFREDDYCHTLITGTIEYDDDALLFTASRELKEEGGFTVPETETARWIFLGTFFPYKDSDRQVPAFAVDVTGLSQEEPTTDGSEKEKKSSLEFLPTNQIMITDETLALAAFLRLFNFFYAKTMGNV